MPGFGDLREGVFDASQLLLVSALPLHNAFQGIGTGLGNEGDGEAVLDPAPGEDEFGIDAARLNCLERNPVAPFPIGAIGPVFGWR